MSILKTAEKILKKGYVDNRCLGRQFAQLLSGFSNEERGKSVRTALALEAEKGEVDIDLQNFAGLKFRNGKIKVDKHDKCYVCDGLMDNLNEVVENVIKEVSDLEFANFHVGVSISQELLEKEESLWEEIGIDSTESIKAELSREVGKAIQNKLGKTVEFEVPEIVILLNLEDNRVDLTIRSVYIKGKYKKFVKIPQTKSFCPKCRGVGCRDCEYSGRFYKDSVQERMSEPFLVATEGIDTVFHGAGREDVDVLCLEGREFVLEVQQPRKRNFDLKKIMKEVNKINKGAVEISDLEFVQKALVEQVKEVRHNKKYSAIVTTEGEIKKTDLKKLEKLVGVINQQTPTRVVQRRADIVRKRKVFSVKTKFIDAHSFELEVLTEAGLYIKELVSGDTERTKPSVTGLLGTSAVIKELNVTGFENTD